MIGFSFSGKLHILLGAGLICLPLAPFAAEQAQTDAKQPVQITLTNNPVAATLPQPPQPIASPAPLTNLVFDSDTKEYKATNGEPFAFFTFLLTNASSTTVHIMEIKPSCGCTTIQTHPMPWLVDPGSNGEIRAQINLAGKFGLIQKTLSIKSTNGLKYLNMKADVPVPPPPVMTDRQKNQELAKADHQAVFKNDCVTCHVTPAVGKMGKELFDKACGICHDTPTRASMVPDLRALNHPTDTDFWKVTITDGKPNTLMPAFAQAHGGPLTPQQIDSLVGYLTANFTRSIKPATNNAPAPAIAPQPAPAPRAALRPSLSPPPPPPAPSAFVPPGSREKSGQ